MILFFFLFLILFEFYAYRSIKIVFKSNLKNLYIITNAIIYLLFFSYIFLFYEGKFNTFFSYNFTIIFILFVCKSIIILFLFFEDILRLLSVFFNLIQTKKKIDLSRRKFISKTALFLGAIPIPIMLHGVFRGRYNYKVVKHIIKYKDLPKNFDGYKITHISDFHCGSFEKRTKIEYAINLINEQNSDIILFTGDFVNNTYDEIIPWKNNFKKLKAKHGKYSVLGNHDYGDYYNWSSEDDKKENFKNLIKIQDEMGFKILMNESIYICKESEKIALIGVENWGDRFKKKGDIDKAISNLDQDDFKILMSHDPSHWEKKIINRDEHFHLTLSGHTHGLQFGIEIPGFIKWSPVQYRYKYWAGLYEKESRFINVNRGFGVLGFPGRVGIWPEISVIELKKG